MFDFPLKKHSTEEIQATIAKALSDLCNTTIEVRIHDISFGNEKTFSSTTLLSLSIDKERPKLENAAF